MDEPRYVVDELMLAKPDAYLSKGFELSSYSFDIRLGPKIVYTNYVNLYTFPGPIPARGLADTAMGLENWHSN